MIDPNAHHSPDRPAETNPTSDRPPGSPLITAAVSTEQAGDVIGVYELLSELGSGGFGVVWLAERREPMLQRVAIKVLRAGMDSRSVLARFEQERQALALMDHPNVARVFDAGATSRGRPYFVMEYVRGDPITTFCDRERLTIRQRLELFISVCEAIQHAHQKGIIHRDIKPSNVLVSFADGKAIPKVIDFGIAKAMTPSLSRQAFVTEADTMVGTPEYMSPEQAGASATDVDTRTDVYALGVVLYELLTGTLPFASSELRSKGHDEVRRIIREVDPPRPSAAITRLHDEAGRRLAANRQISEGALRHMLSRDLEWIPLKALRKERDRRYPSAAALADDVRRYLEDKPLVAAPESAAYRARTFLRRHRVGVAACAAVGVAILAGLFGTGAGLLRAQARATEAEAARAAAEQAKSTATAVATLLRDMLGGINPDRAQGRDSSILREILNEALTRLDSGELAASPLAELELRDTISRAQTAVGDLEAAKSTLARGLTLARSLGDQGRYWLAQLLGASASLMANAGDLDASAAAADEALATRRAISADDSPELAQALNNVGSVQYALGNFQVAADRQKEALDMFRRIHPGPHRETAQTLSNLGLTYMDLGEFDRAQSLNFEAVAMSRQLYKGDHPDLVSHLNNLAAAYVASGRMNEGVTTYREVLAMSRRLYPGDHVDTALAINNLAAATDDAGDKLGAYPLYVEALEMRKRILPPDHPSTAISLGNVAYNLRTRGKLADAEPYAKAAAEMSARVYTHDHPNAARTIRSYGSLLFDLGRFDEALTPLANAASIFERLGPDFASDLAPTRNAIARAMVALHRYDEAMRLTDQVLEMSKSIDGSAPYQVRAHIERAKCLHAQGRSEAVEELRAAESIAKRELKPDDALQAAIAEARTLLGLPETAQPPRDP